MHDPMTVAFNVPNPFWWKRNYNNKWKPSTLATIWHVDPEKDGSDDSCGWFIRSRHLNEKTLDKIARDFEFEWSHGVPTGWFADNGEPNYSTHAIVLGMFRIASGVIFGHWSRRQKRFLRKHLVEILCFAENNCDSMFAFIQQSYGRDSKDAAERAAEAAGIIYPWIMRAVRPWYRHPRWHVWHWKVNVDCIQHFKRWAFSRCCRCGKRFRWGYSPTTSNWDSGGPRWFKSEPDVHHGDCQHPDSACAAMKEKTEQKGTEE